MSHFEVPETAPNRVVAVLVLLALAALPLVAEAPSTTVILVRHAEKLLTGGDVDLSAAGHERAQALVEVVASAGVDLAIASRFKRTRQTLSPSVEDLELTMLEITEPADVAKDILENRRGETILVAGHSNTVPQIIEALGASSLCPPFEIDEEYGCMIPDPEYHHLFVVRVPATGSPTVVRARYGLDSR